MALVVEDGTGRTDAESFVSVADATTYLTDRGREAGWTALTTAQQEEHLRNATEYLVAKFARVWRGHKNTREQALPWPRVGVIDDDGYQLDSNVLPTQLVRATIEAALRDATVTGGLLPDISQAGELKSKTTKIGPIQISKEWVEGGSDRVFFRRVRLWVNGLIQPAGTVMRA